ncbi:hypothetical protein J7F03_23130 [Streptomyces sp. ISL-43]|uniref:hypothetical protein n=1 Tax=Streptomyces sp. ISL-43 TaxID=2819183 RepID=UPI001BEC18CE|nr:hypothetical protein [Streptomyces sp. ISL-43]MBT2449914.1 hypothetical protein [Streptomyces sp. ISL-43]
MRILHGTKSKVLVTGAALAGALALASGPAYASSTNVSGQVGGSYTYYGTGRTITSNGSNVYIQINNPGGAMVVKWYKCDNRSVHGADVEVGDGRRHLIGSNFKAGTVFCLAAAADVSEIKLNWSGTLNWNVYS